MTEISNAKTYGIFASRESRSIIKKLTESENPFIELPEAEILEIELSADSKKTLKNIHCFDWLIFDEPTAVRIFLERLCEYEIDFFELDSLRICVFGELTSDELRFAQIHSDLIYTHKENPFELIKAFISNEKEFLKQKILWLTGRTSKSDAEFFAGQTKIMNLFELREGKGENRAKLKALLNGGAIDEIIVTSPKDLMALDTLYLNGSNPVQANDFTFRAANENLMLYLKESGYRAKIFT